MPPRYIIRKRGPANYSRFTDHVQKHIAAMRRGAVLEEINALPRAERHAPILHRNGKLRGRQRRADVRGHVVGAFDGVPVKPIVLGHHAAEERVEIGLDIGVGIFLNQQRGRCVLHEDRQQAGLDVEAAQPMRYLPRDFVKPFAARRDGEAVRENDHALLNRDALGQIARLIHVAAAPHGDVIRQQLQRHDLENRRQQIGRRRNLDHVVGHLAHLRRRPRVAIATTMPSRAFTS